jgi:hypothetical protein
MADSIILHKGVAASNTLRLKTRKDENLFRVGAMSAMANKEVLNDPRLAWLARLSKQTGRS